jgi:hypothetical protein
VTPHLPQTGDFDATVEDLALRFAEALTAVLGDDKPTAVRDFEHLLARAQDLIVRKQGMQGTKSETRDLVGELMFSRLRKGFRAFLQAPRKPEEEIRAAEWVLGAVIGTSALSDFASVIDAAILTGSGPKDYSFAGRTDFIAIEEVLQMIGSGKHTGCLGLEKHDNRLDIYINRGQIAFLDPHHIVRRVLPGTTTMKYREIAATTIEEAVQRHAQEGVPVFMTLAERGEFKEHDVRAVMRQLGCEVLFDFMRQQGDSHFSYRRLDQLPRFASENDLRLGITPVLLEVSKQLDDWRSMARAFPDPREPVQPMPDMLARISGLTLGVLEIKMLTMIDGENSPETLSALTGLPIFEIYQLLVTFAQEGAIVAPGGPESLLEANLSAEESMRDAFEALDANDDGVAMNSALDRVLGDTGGVGFDRSALDFLDDRG